MSLSKISTIVLPLIGWLGAQAAQPTFAWAQAEVTALARATEPLTETGDLACTRFASFEVEPTVTLGMQLEPGDLIASVSGDTDLELTCPGGSLLRFTGNFRVLVDAPGEGADCAVDFLSGTLDVLTDQPTEVNAGGVVLGTEGTQFTVEVLRREGVAEQECKVWDGRVKWRAKGLDEEKWVKGGERLELAAAKLPPEVFMRIEPEKIAHQDLERAAARYARFDLAKSRALAGRIEDPEATSKKLAELHYQVLEKPDDDSRRVELAKAQLAVQVSKAATYNLNRAGVRSDDELRRHQIDPAQLKALSVQPGAGTLGSIPVPAPPPSDPFALIEQKRHREAIPILKQRLESGQATARDVCGLARAYFHLEGRGQRSASHAERAIRRASDGTLKGDELRLCRFLAPG